MISYIQSTSRNRLCLTWVCVLSVLYSLNGFACGKGQNPNKESPYPNLNPPPYAPSAPVQAMTSYDFPEMLKKRHIEFFNKYSSKYEETLKNLQLVLIIDRSGSQGYKDKYPLGPTAPKGIFPGKWTQWDNSLIVAKNLAESLFQYDADGNIPVYFFDDEVNKLNASTPADLIDAFDNFKPRSGTNLYSALEVAFRENIPATINQHILFIVITDGQPNSGQEGPIKELIQTSLAKRDPNGDLLNILFIRIGDDANAIRFLRDLDDCKEVGKNVDTKSDNVIYKMGPKNAVLNAIYEHLDSDFPSENQIDE